MCMKKFRPDKFRRCCMDFPHNRSHLKFLVCEHFNILSIVGKIRQYENFFINLLVLQFSPTNPWVQSQEYEFKPSTHTPLFKQGVGWQLSMSEFIHKMSK